MTTGRNLQIMLKGLLEYMSMMCDCGDLVFAAFYQVLNTKGRNKSLIPIVNKCSKIW